MHGAIICCILLLVSPCVAIVYVSTKSTFDGPFCGNSSTPCLQIQTAINNAVNGDVIMLLNDGVYHDTNVSVVAKNLSIVGSSIDTRWECQYGQNSRDKHNAVSFFGCCATLIQNISFSGCIRTSSSSNANLQGGAVSIHNCTDISKVSDCSFSNCSANSEGTNAAVAGGSLYVFAKCLDVIGCQFYNSQIFTLSGSGHGGAIFFKGGQMTVNNTIIHNSSIVTASGSANSALGGGVFVQSDVLVQFTRSNITSNQVVGKPSILESTGGQGGGIYITGREAAAVIYDCLLIDNKVTAQNGGVAQGGAVHFSFLKQTTITDSFFERNTVLGGNSLTGNDGGEGFGGAISIQSGNITISRSLFNQNLCRGGESSLSSGGSCSGGAVYATGYSVSVLNTSVSDNQCEGGFSDRYVGGDGIGAGIAIFSNTVLLSNITIEKCNSTGGFGIRGGGKAYGVLIINNSNARDFLVDVQNSVISNSNVVGGWAKDGTGGEVNGFVSVLMNSESVTSKSRMTVLNCSFDSNRVFDGFIRNKRFQSSILWGGLHVSNANVNAFDLLVHDAVFTNNQVTSLSETAFSSSAGGSIVLRNIRAFFSNVWISNSTVSTFSSGIAFGGAIFAYNSSLSWNNGSISNSKTMINIKKGSGQSLGGGIYSSYSHLNISNVSIQNNAASYQSNDHLDASCVLSSLDPEPNFSEGGGIYTTITSASITGCNFTNNFAYCGGAISYNHGGYNSSIINSNFWNNTGYCSGGAMNIAGFSVSPSNISSVKDTFLVTNSTFYNSQGLYGAHIRLDTWFSTLFTTVLFAYGNAKYGGVFWVKSGPDSQNAFSNIIVSGKSVFSNNNAWMGGSILASSGNMTGYAHCEECLFYNNSASYGLMDGKYASPPYRIVATCPASETLNNSTFSVQISLADAFGTQVQGPFFSRKYIFSIIASSNTTECTLINTEKGSFYAAFTNSGIAELNGLYILAKNATLCLLQLKVFGFVTPLDSSCSVLMEGCPKGMNMKYGITDQCVTKPKRCSISCKLLLLSLFIFLSLILIITAYLMVKRIKKWQRIRNATPSILVGKPSITVMEILNDPDIPVLNTNSVKIDGIMASGSQGCVFKGTLVDSKTAVAIKQLHVHDLLQEEVTNFCTEIKLTSLLIHKNICPFIGVLIMEEQKVGMVSEFMPVGSLHSFITDKANVIPMDMRIRFLKDIARGLAYMHSCNIIHRDLKPDNCLLSEDLRVVIADLGCSTVLGDKQHRTLTLHGTPNYMAPELLSNSSCSNKIDIYSLGIMINEIISLKVPYESPEFKSIHSFELFNMVIAGNARPFIDPDIHPVVRSLIEESWHTDPSIRPTASEILKRLKRMKNIKIFVNDTEEN